MKQVKNGIYQINGGKFLARVRKRGHSLSETFTTLKQAETWKKSEEKRIENIRAKLPNEINEKLTVANLILDWSIKVGQHHKGWHQEKLIFKNYPESITRLEIKGVDERTIQKWVDGLVASGLKPSTIQKRVKLLSQVFRWGVKEYVDLRGIDNPMKYVKSPKVGDEDKRDRTATEEEIAALRQHITPKSKHLADYILLAVETTARRGDLFKLKYENISFENSTVKFLDGKTGDRTAPLSPLALSILKNRRDTIGTPWVFPNYKKTDHIKADSLSQAFLRIRSAASKELPSIKTLRLHDLRHTGATRWSDKMNIFELQKITGHKTLSMLNRYVNKEAEDVAVKMRALTDTTKRTV
jgi:integrase